MSDDESVSFTKEDFAALRETVTVVKGMSDKIDALTASIQQCQINCGNRREKVDKRVTALEDFRTQVVAYTVAASLVISLVGNWVVTKIFGGS
jgi:hypothetical protein